MDAASQLDALRDRLWPPVLAKRLDKELRGLAERAVSLPEAHTLKRHAGCSGFPRCFCSRPLTWDERKALESLE
jgi:hypothetical protein